MNSCENCIDNRPRIGRLAGVTRTLRLAIYEGEGIPVGTPQDLSGLTVAVQVLRDGTDDVFVPEFAISGDDNNVIEFVWPAERQAVGNYTIQVTTADGSGNINRVNWHGPTGIRLVQYSYQVYGDDATGEASSESVGLIGYYTTSGVGMSAYDEWLSSPESDGWPQTVSGFLAYLKQPATDAAAALEQVVNEKMAEVDETMVEVQEQADADHTRAESDHARAESDHTIATGDHTRAEADHVQAVTDSQQAEIDAAAAASDREKAATDRTKAANDRQQAAVDHGTAAQDHATASSDHQQAQSDHSTASADHTKATQDAERAASDHTRAGDDHDTAVADHHSAETDHTRAEQDHTASAAATGAANEAAQTATEAAEAADAARESIEGELAKKANVEGYYGGLTAGSAENLVGRGSVEAEIQGIRTSAGQEDIGTGAAIIREVRGKSLVWNVARLRYLSKTTSDTLFSIESADAIRYTFSSGSDYYSRFVIDPITIINGHKYYCKFRFSQVVQTGGLGFTFDLRSSDNKPLLYPVSRERYNMEDGYYARITSSSDSGTAVQCQVSCTSSGKHPAGDTGLYSNAFIIDLTIMFGAGNEPTTVEEFERMFFLPFYENNAGTIINNEATGLRTRGFNLFNPVTGKAVLPGKYSDYPYEYELCGAFTSISFEEYAGNVSTPELSDGRFFNVPSPGVLTVVGGNAKDTCVHLVWSGLRNYGQPDYVYEPYWENTLQINTTAITGKLNGEGESVVISPNGMCGVGTAYDRLVVDPDGFARQGQVKMVELDLASRNWSLRNTGNQKKVYSASLPYAYRSFPVSSSYLSANCISLGISIAGGTSLAYINNVGVDNMNDGLYFFTEAAGKDVAVYAIVPLSSEGISGTLLYEIATPLEYVLDTPIPLTYMVDDFGTEAKLPVDTAELPTGPLCFAVTYPFNAVDKLRRLPTNYLSKESTEAMLNALQSAGIIGGYTMTYNATTEQYIFSITAPSTTPDETTD